MALDPKKNFAIVEVLTGYDAAAVSVVLQSGEGAALPDPSTDGAFNLTWWNYTDNSLSPSGDANVEIVRCTARSTDTLTVTRAQEGTSATTKNDGGDTYYMALGVTKKDWDDLSEYGFGLSGDATELTIASGVVSITQCLHTIDTESDASSDDLVTINGGVEGQVICIWPEHTDRTVKVLTTGNIRVNGGDEFWMSDTRDSLTLQYHSSLWREVSHNSQKGWMTLGPQQTLSVSGNTITPESTNVAADTSGGAVTVNTITAMPEGCIIVCGASAASAATYDDGAGNLYLAGGDFVTNTTSDRLMLISDGTGWFELSRSDN